MKKKGTKIRRYGNIYGRGMGSGSWQIVVAMIAGVLLFGVIGWSLYTPIHSWIAGLGEERPAASSMAPVLSSQPQQEPDDSSSSAQGGAAALPVLPRPEPQTEGTVNGIYLPVSALSDPSVVSGFLERASSAGLNTVVVEAKDATGTVLYASKNESARQLGAEDLAAYDAAAVAKTIRDAGFVPAARLHAFRDNLAPVYERGMGVRYYDTESLWYDNDPAQGGKPWLNPCSAQVREYLVSLASELVSSGFDIILLDSVQFPSGLGLEKAGYGIANPDRAQVLDGFITQVRKTVEDAGGRLIVCLPSDALLPGDEAGDALITLNNQMIYGGNPAPRMTGQVMVTLSNDPAVSKGILSRARTENTQAKWLGLIPAYRNDGSLLGSTSLLSGIDPAGYLLYNPSGNYQLQ